MSLCTAEFSATFSGKSGAQNFKRDVQRVSCRGFRLVLSITKKTKEFTLYGQTKATIYIAGHLCQSAWPQ